MTNFLLPDAAPRHLSFYLAMEEYIARAYGEGFFVWCVEPTVIIGRNQDLETEVNVGYCLSHGIRVYRRKSGGGCVYADQGNLMISCITPGINVESAFSMYLSRLASLLRRMGFEATTTQHNDVLIDGRKVSGNAFFAAGASGIVHGTLLYDVNLAEMQSAITPSYEKLGSHGVKSVRQRVVNLRELGGAPDFSTLKAGVVSEFSDAEKVLSTDEVLEIERAEDACLDS